MTAALFAVGVLVTLLAVAGMFLATPSGAIAVTESASNLSGAPDETEPETETETVASAPAVPVVPSQVV